MMRPGFDVFDQLAELGVNLISLPIETTNETLMQNITYIKEKLELKVGVWAWQGCPVVFFEQYIHPYVDIIEYESRAPFWVKPKAGKSPHTIEPIVVSSVRRLHEMIVAAGMEDRIELMEDGGLSASNVAEFVEAGMTVGEFSSPLLKGPIWGRGCAPPPNPHLRNGANSLERHTYYAKTRHCHGWLRRRRALAHTGVSLHPVSLRPHNGHGADCCRGGKQARRGQAGGPRDRV